MLRTTKVRIYPTPEQAVFLDRQFGAVRFVFNKALHIMSHRYKHHGDKLSAKYDLKKLIAIAKKTERYSWLKDFDAIALQQSCINLDKAFQHFFSRRAQYPRFKRKHGKQSSYHASGIKVLDGAIKIPKLTPIKARLHRNIEGKVKSITLSKTCTGKYYASILADDGQDVSEPLTRVDESQIIGLDMGLTHLVIDSNGHKENNPRFLTRAEKNLKRKQRQLSRKRKGSQSRTKARRHVAKAHERLANARNDYQHKLTRRLANENQVVVVETLNVKNMMKNRRLAKHIGDASWQSFIAKLEYKAVKVVKIDLWFASSKTCSHCHHKADNMPLNIREWQCLNCGTTHDRDINAAMNIKQRGIVQLKADGLTVSANGGKRQSSTSLAAA